MQELFASTPQPTCRAARVLVDGLNDMVLDYAIPEGMEGVVRGCRVELPLRNRHTTGTVLQVVEDGRWEGELRPLCRLVDAAPIVSPCSWMWRSGPRATTPCPWSR